MDGKLTKGWNEVKGIMNGNLVHTDVVLENNTGLQPLSTKDVNATLQSTETLRKVSDSSSLVTKLEK